MAKVQLAGKQNAGVARVEENQSVDARSTRDGSLFTADWKQAMILEGRGFMINLGAFSTPVKGGGAGSTVIDLDTPEFIIGVPSGTSIMPLRVDVELLITPGAADDDELDILIAVDQDKMNPSSSGTATAEVIYNMNTLHQRASACWAKSEYSATCTDPVLDLELMHVTKIFELHDSSGVLWGGATMLYEPDTLVVINGPAMLCGYFGGTKLMNGFATVQWLELPTSYF